MPFQYKTEGRARKIKTSKKLKFPICCIMSKKNVTGKNCLEGKIRLNYAITFLR